MIKRKIYDKYMSNIYARSGRILNIEKEYSSMYFWNKKYIAPFLPKNKKCRVLDVGCGLGQNLFALSKLGYLNNLGIDISKECVDFCKDRGLSVLEVSVENYLKDKISSFDVIISSHLLEHIEKDESVEFIRILKSGLKKTVF